MSAATLIRLGGLAAILAGVLRAGCSFIPYSPQPGVLLERLYFLIDVLLLFGVSGIYAHLYKRVGEFSVLALLGYLLSITGLAFIRKIIGTIGTMDSYVAGATLLSVGLCLLSVAILSAGSLPRWVPALWILSTIVGVGGHFAGGPAITFEIAGLAFGLAFVGAGVRLCSDPALKAGA